MNAKTSDGTTSSAFHDSRGKEAPPRAGQQAVPVAVPAAAAAAPSPARRGWVWLVVLVVLLGLGGAAYFLVPRYLHGASSGAAAGADPAGKKGAREIPVLVATARTADLGLYLSGLGSAAPLKTVVLHSRVDGQIMRIAFHEGQLVHEGDLLIEIDPRPYQAQLEQAQGQMARDAAQLRNSKLDLERDQMLAASKSITPQQLDTQKAVVAQFEGTIKSDQAMIDNAQLQLTYSRITAPVTGLIGLELVNLGNIVHASDSGGLAVINQIQPISVIFSIAEDSLPQVLAKMPMIPKGRASDGGGDPHGPPATQQATSTTLPADPAADPATRPRRRPPAARVASWLTSTTATSSARSRPERWRRSTARSTPAQAPSN